jgi:uncharacterized protein (TIGR02147 family)
VADRAPIDIFKYLDYRKFLADYYRSRKPSGFSYRVFSRRAGVSSPNYLKLVIQGERNLTASMAVRFAKACNLQDESADYFANLVRFNQAKTLAERDRVYQDLNAFKRYRSCQRLELAHAAYCSNWYMPAIREMAARADFREDPKWIAKQLWPSIKPSQAANALDDLLRIGLLQRNSNGRIFQGTPFVTTGAETEDMHVAQYHRAMMVRAAEAIDSIPASERDISSLTFCFSRNGITELKKRMRLFRQEIIGIAEAEPAPHQVFQLNLQLFPLSISGDGEGEA